MPHFPQLPLTEKELVALFVAQKAIAQYQGTSSQPVLKAAFRKTSYRSEKVYGRIKENRRAAAPLARRPRFGESTKSNPAERHSTIESCRRCRLNHILALLSCRSPREKRVERQ